MANAVGMAIAEAQLAARCNRLDHALMDHYTCALVSDRDLMEGVGAEAASFAGHLRLGRHICLNDDNYVTLSSGTDITFMEDRAARFRVYGWHTIRVEDGNDLAAIDMALTEAHENTLQPSLILICTHIGYGSPEQDSYKAHGSPPGVEDVRRTKERLNSPAEPAFCVPDAALAHFRMALDRGAKSETDWNSRRSAYTKAFPELALELKGNLRGVLPAGWNTDIPVFAADTKGIATREASGQIMNPIAPELPTLTGGSADLETSTKTALKGFGDFNPLLTAGEDAQGSEGGGWSFAGRNLHFGVREHAMGAILNGMPAHGGMLAYGATFLISDYMRPAPGKTVLREYGFTIGNVCSRARALLS